MLHACLVSTFLCFVYTLRCFYIFSGTNLLTSCLFSSVFGSRKAENQYSRNWMGQKPKSIFYRGEHETIVQDGEAPEGGQTPPEHGQAWPMPGEGVGPLVASQPRLFAYKKPPTQKTLSTRSIFHETVCSRRHHRP